MTTNHTDHADTIHEVLDVALERTHLEDPLRVDIEDAHAALDALVADLKAQGRKLSCDYETGKGQNCGECLDCLKVQWFFAQEAIKHQDAKIEAAEQRAEQAERERDEALTAAGLRTTADRRRSRCVEGAGRRRERKRRRGNDSYARS